MFFISPAIDQALAILVPRLKTSRVLWVITGSLGMALQGMDIEVHDIDLQTDEPGAYAILSLFPEFVHEPVRFKESEGIRSHIGVLDIHGQKVEVMGDIETRPEGSDWVPAPDLLPLIRWVEYAGLQLPVLDLEYEYHAYARMGRVAKAAKIRYFLDKKEST